MNPFVGLRYKNIGRVLRDYCFGLNTRQNMDEFLEFLRQWGRPKTILEIGTGAGGTLALFHLFAPPDATIVSVDLWGGAFGAGYPPWKRLLFKCFKQHDQRQVLLYGNSHKVRTRERIRRALGGQPIDLFFIDGDHTYHGVQKDFLNYFGLVRSGGIVAFHDISGNPDSRYGVKEYWQKLKLIYNHAEICKNGNGIGLIYK